MFGKPEAIDGLRGQVPISPDCVFDASLVPETCLGRFCDMKGLINKFLESVYQDLVGPVNAWGNQFFALARSPTGHAVGSDRQQKESRAKAAGEYIDSHAAREMELMV